MRISWFSPVVALLLPLCALAQTPAPPAPASPGQMGIVPEPGRRMSIRRKMGKNMGEWWKNSEVAQKLQLSDAQIGQLDQIFYDHRLRLIDDGAAMEKEDLKLQTLLDADVANEGQVGAQVDQVLAARGKLEREYTMMNLDLRKVLSVEQWRQLRSLREERGPGGGVFFYKKLPKGAGSPPPGLPPPPEPGEMF
jgi:Spy/CpxP family protein refolding chaperone